MAALLLTYPVVTPTVTLQLRPNLVSLTNPQLTFAQHIHIAQGGRSFVFSPAGAQPVENHILPVDLRNLHEADEDGYTGWTTLKAFLRTTLQGAANLCKLTDPDGDIYIVRYLRGIETVQEGIQGQVSGQLIFRVEPA